MAGSESKISLTEGAGKNAHTLQRTITGPGVVEDEYVQLGEPGLLTYSVTFASILTTTAASHLVQIMAGASLVVRIRRIWVTQNVAPAAVTAFPLQLVRLTTAGTGGTAATPRPFDTASAAAGATGMSLPTAKGTEGVFLLDKTIWLGTGAIPVRDEAVLWQQMQNAQPLVIPVGTGNGIAIKNTAGIATSTVSITVEFTETSFV